MVAITFSAIAIYYVGKIIDKAVADNGYTGIKGWFFPKKRYTAELSKILTDTIYEFDAKNQRAEQGKYPFYQSKILFDALSDYYLYKENNPELIQSMFDANPNVLKPTQSELNDFYSLFQGNVSSSKQLKKLFREENYQEEIYNQSEKLDFLSKTTVELLKEIKTLSNKFDEQLLSKIQNKFDNKLIIQNNYNFQGLSVNAKIEQYSAREILVKELTEMIRSYPWVALHGNVSMGKTQLAILISDNFINSYWLELKGIDQQQLQHTIIQELLAHFSPENRNLSLQDLVNLIPEHSLLILDDLPKLSFSKTELGIFLDLINKLKEKSIYLLTTSNFTLPSGICEMFPAIKEYSVPYLSKDEILEIMVSYGGGEVHAVLSNVIATLSSGHPAIVTAIIRFLSSGDWKLDSEKLVELFSGSYASGLEDEVNEKLLKTVTDEETRALLYRLKLVLGTITNKEIEIVANVKPDVSHANEKINALQGLWIQKTKPGNYELSPLVKQINNSLSSKLIKQISQKLGNQILSTKKLNQVEANRAIRYFISAEDFSKAGFVLTVVLESAQKNPSLFFDWGFDSYWLTVSLPEKMDIFLKAVIRFFQINLVRNHGAPIDFLINDLENIVNQAGARNINVAPVLLQLTLYFAEKDSNKANKYLSLAIASTDDLEISAAVNTIDDTSLNAEMLIWNNLLGVQNLEDFNNWFRLLESLNTEKIQASMQGDLHFASSFIFTSKVYENEQKRATPDWNLAIQFLDEIIIRTIGNPELFILPMAIKQKIKILMVHVNDMDQAKMTYENGLSALQGCSRQESIFIIKDEYGRQLSSKGFKDSALSILLEAEKIETPKILTDKIYTYLALNELLSETKPKEALKYMTLAIQLQKSNPFVNESESAKIHGEYAIALWENDKKEEAFYQIEIGLDKVLNSYQPEADYQSTIIRLGHALNYFFHLYEGRTPPLTEGEEYMKPFPGMFYRDTDLLLKGGYYFDQRKFMQAFLMLQCFETLGDLEYAKKWASITFKFDEEDPINPFRNVLMRTNAYSIIDGNYLETFRRGFDIIKSSNEGIQQDSSSLSPIIQKVITDRKKSNFENADVFLFSYIFIFMVTDLLHKFDNERDKQIIQDFLQVSPELRTFLANPAAFDSIIEGLGYLIDETKSIEDIINLHHADPDLSDSIKLLLYIIASLKANIDDAFKLHLSSIARLELMSNQVAGIANHYFITVPFIVDFWTKRILSQNDRFNEYEFLKKNGIEKIEKANIHSKLKMLFKVLAYHLNYEPSEAEEKWLNS